MERPCMAFVVLKRLQGLMLALPPDAMIEEYVLKAQQAGPNDLLGPSTLADVAGAAMDFAFPLADPMDVDIPVKVLLMDVSLDITPHLKQLADFQLDQIRAFAEDPGIVPRPAALVEEVDRWVSNSDANTRIGYYSAEEEHVPEVPPVEEEAQPSPKAPGVRARQRPGGTGGEGQAATPKKRHTVASLADGLEKVTAALPSIMQQLADLTQKVDSGSPTSRASALKQPLGSLVSTGSAKASAPLGSYLQQMPPPRSTAPRVVVSSAPKYIQGDAEELARDRLEGLGQDAVLGSSELTRAMLIQSQALNALVGQIAGSSSDPIHDLALSSAVSTRGAAGRARLQAELASQRALFYKSVMQSMARRMQPSLPADRPIAELQDRGVCATRYLERFGGFGRVKEYGHLAWHVALIMDHIQSESWEAVKDSTALLLVCLEQFALDQGKTDLGLLMTLAEEPPQGVFTNRSLAPGARQVAFAPLADQRWITTALQYIKELDTISSRRGEVAQPKNPPPAPNPKGGPKKKPKGAGKRQKDDEEAVE
eukprot:Skav231303  [mRNA]  locus=scaffold161:316430:318046:- [translate_table: standard]